MLLESNIALIITIQLKRLEWKKFLTSLNPELKIVLVLAKLRTCPLTTLMPRSSLALSSSTIELNSFGL